MAAAKNIFIFGDSITYGEWDASGGWASRLREHYDALVLPLPEDHIVTYNLGIPSDTSEGVAERLTRETQSRISPNPDVNNYQFIIAIGTNDSRWLIDENKNAVDIAQYKANLVDITKQAKAFTSDIVFVGLLPCVESQVSATATRLGWDVSYENQYIQTYNKALRKHCKDENIKFINLIESLKNQDIESFFDDGLHPNTDGHALIFDLVLAFLEETP